MTFALTCLLTFCLARGLFLRSVMARDQRVRCEQHGLVSIELRRRAHLVAHRDSSGGLSFPEPRETRTLVLRVAGLPVWRRVASIGLPRAVEDTIHHVSAHDFDASFSSQFRAGEASHFELPLA